jgi:hypothetical protein
MIIKCLITFFKHTINSVKNFDQLMNSLKITKGEVSMPVKRCQINGKKGWKWGTKGKCYVGPKAKEKAMAQGKAAFAAGYKPKDE